MMYGVPLVQEEPQVIYGGIPSGPIPHFTMGAVDRHVVGAHEYDFNPVPLELQSILYPSTLGPLTGRRGVHGLYGIGLNEPTTVTAVEAAGIRPSTWTAVIGASAVLLLGSIALWAYKKF